MDGYLKEITLFNKRNKKIMENLLDSCNAHLTCITKYLNNRIFLLLVFDG